MKVRWSKPPLQFCAGLSAKVETPPFFSSSSRTLYRAFRRIVPGLANGAGDRYLLPEEFHNQACQRSVSSGFFSACFEIELQSARSACRALITIEGI
jgi:hypothetical protein